MYQVLTLIRFDRFDEVLEITKKPSDLVEGGAWGLGQGYAWLRNGETDFARAHLNLVFVAAANSSAVFRFHSARDLLGTLRFRN